jgi:hypothetical protein
MLDEFYRTTRIGEDGCGLTQDMLLNNHHAAYMLQNYYMGECTMRRPIEFATNQVSVNFQGAGGGGKQCGLGGCNIGESNDLLFGAPTQPRCRISLLQRQFLTVPYLGKGTFDCALETRLRMSESAIANRKSVNAASEVSYIPLSNYPLIDSIQSTVTNPEYLVESWTRGGDSARKVPGAKV